MAFGMQRYAGIWLPAVNHSHLFVHVFLFASGCCVVWERCCISITLHVDQQASAVRVIMEKRQTDIDSPVQNVHSTFRRQLLSYTTNSSHIEVMHLFICPWKWTVVARSFENDININFHKICCLRFYDGNLHILRNVLKRDQMNCN